MDIVPHSKPTRVGETLSFSQNFWVYLVYLKICLSLVKKSSFGAIFLEKITKSEQIKKKIGFQLANYRVFKKLAWVFGRKLLEFFRNVQKKPDVYQFSKPLTWEKSRLVSDWNCFKLKFT